MNGKTLAEVKEELKKQGLDKNAINKLAPLKCLKVINLPIHF